MKYKFLVPAVVVATLRTVSQTPPTLHPCTVFHGPTSTAQTTRQITRSQLQLLTESKRKKSKGKKVKVVYSC